MAVHRLSRARFLAPLLALALTLGVVTVVQAATSSEGSVGPTNPSTSWQGQSYAAAATVDPAACPPASADPGNALCDHFTITSAVDSAYWDANTGGLQVSISWADSVNDFDLYVYDSAGNVVGSSAQGSTTSEQTVVPDAAGTYEVRVVPYAVVDSDYLGTATFLSQPSDATTSPAGGPAAYNGVRITGELPAEEPQSTPAAYSGDPLILQTTDVGREAAEPTIAVDKSGTAYYAAAAFDSAVGQARTELLRSRDGGLSFESIQPTVAGQDAHPQTLDPYVYVEEDSGRLFDLDLLVATAELSFSDDQGETYTTNPNAAGTNFVNDHQTLFAGPVPAASGLTTLDPAFPEILYYCFNRVADSSCSRSLDGGLTFANTGAPAYLGFDPEAGGLCGGLHGHLATDSDGRVFLPKGHCGFPWISVSEDAGTTWNQVQVSDTVDMPDNQSAVAADAAGNLFYAWYDSTYKLPFMATSTDSGLTWSDPLMIAPPGVREVQWPTIAAGDDGRIAITFPGTTTADDADLSRPWNSYVVVSTNALDADPLFVSNIANPADDPVHRGDCPGRCGNMLDFLDVIVSPSDGMAWATAVDTCTEQNDCAANPNAVGFDEDSSSDNDASDMRGLAVRQVSGPTLIDNGSGNDCDRKVDNKGKTRCKKQKQPKKGQG